jgi:hypothetical protein
MANLNLHGWLFIRTVLNPSLRCVEQMIAMQESRELSAKQHDA